MEEMNLGLAPMIELCDEDDVILPDVSKAETELPSLNHADLARDFLASEYGKNFYRVYDMPSKPVASWTGTRWVIADDNSYTLTVGSEAPHELLLRLRPSYSVADGLNSGHMQKLTQRLHLPYREQRLVSVLQHGGLTPGRSGLFSTLLRFHVP